MCRAVHKLEEKFSNKNKAVNEKWQHWLKSEKRIKFL